MKIKPHVRMRGRPKQSSMLWPSKSKRTGKRKCLQGKENFPPSKKAHVGNVSIVKRGPPEQGTPAYLIKKRREFFTKSSEVVTRIDVDNYQAHCARAHMDLPEFNINGYPVLTTDIRILKSDHMWLNERLINAGQQLLRESFPHVSGLHDVALANTTDKISGIFVQIINVAQSHWICVSNHDRKLGAIMVYDSMKTGDLPVSAKEVIAALLKCDKKKIYLLFSDVQQQPDSASCGLFSLAYAYSLCEGKDPTKIQYSVSDMRSHLLTCLEQLKFVPFPSKPVTHNPSKPTMTSFKIYCLCRLPERGDEMVCCTCDGCRVVSFYLYWD